MDNSSIQALVHAEFTKYPKRAYEKGQILVYGNEEPAYVYYVLRGKVREYGITGRGDEVVLNLFKSPAFFPMSWALNRSPNAYFYRTEESTELHLVPPDAAVAFLKSHPDIALDLLSRVYRGAEGLFGKMIQLMSGTARSRLVYELLTESRRFGTRQSDGSVRLDINESDLAARSGLTRETVSREMQKIKADQCVQVSQAGIVITDLDKLETAFHQAD